MAADTKLIEVTGGGLTAQVPDVSVTSSTVTPEITADVAAPLIDSPDTKEKLLEVVVTGLGEENIPDARLFKFLSDKFKLQEAVVRQVFKNLNDLTSTDDQARKLLQKVLSDATTNSDVFNRVWVALRSFTESTSNTELVQKDFAKAILDLANAPDLLTTSVGKYLLDVTALANLSYAVMLVGKDLQDQTIGFQDVLSTIVDFNRTFEDTAFTTDDFYGAANIDDDQIATVFKVLLNWVTPQETFSVDLDRPDITDQSTVSEQAELLVELPKFDQVSKSDLQFSTIAPNKLDQVSNTEQQVFVVTKPDLQDQALALEQASVSSTKPVFDQTTNADAVSNTVGQTSQESTTTSELYNFDVSKADRFDTATALEQAELSVTTTLVPDSFSVGELILNKLIGINVNEIDYFLEDYTFDSTNYTFKAVHATDTITQVTVSKDLVDLVDATDDFYGAANIDDDQIAAFDKVLVDYVGFYEAFDRVVAYIRLFAETATALEQVELTAQKALSNQTANSELFTVLTEKSVLDQALLAESQVFEAEQTSFDQATLSEQALLDLVLPKTDTVSNSDTVATFYQAVRQFNELTNSSVQVEKLLETVYSDLGTLSDALLQTVEKILADQTANTEQLAFDFFAEHSDLVDATDDFYGAANIDDDQIAAFDKVLADYATNSETVVTVAEFYRTFLEAFVVADQAVLDFVKQLTELAVITEVVALDFGTSRQETVAALDTPVLDFDTSRQELVQQTDLFTQSIEPNKFEVTTTSDTTVYDIGQQKLETALTSEVVAADVLTDRSDIATIIETFISEFVAYRDFYETVTQTDVVDLHPNKSALETFQLSDAQVFGINSRIADTTATSEVVGKDSTTEFTDLVDATDDFAGAATIGDDQYAEFQKSINDYAAGSEVFSTLTNFLRSVNESQVLSEVFAAATDKALSDINNSSDTVNLLTQPSKLDAVATFQLISLTLQSYFSEDYAQLGYTGETYTY